MKTLKLDIQEKCLDCVCYHSEGNMNLPCNGAFPVRCEYNDTEEEEEEE